MIDTENISNVILLSGHSKCVKSVCFDPSGDFLVSAGCDETIRVWDVKEEKCIQVLDKIISAFDAEDMEPLKISWHKSGKYFAVPGRKGDILLIQKGSWKVMGNIRGGHIKVR